MSAASTDPSLSTSERRIRRRVDPRVLRRGLVSGVIIAALLAGAYLIPFPSIGRVREWGEHLGPWFPWVFFLAYAVITIGPIPRTTFTVMSGIFFGPALGFTGAITASVIAAFSAFLLARSVGRERVQRHLKKAVMVTVEHRLEQRGWLAVGSLRLIPVCPFPITNYCSGLSSVRTMPYLIASAIAMMPGTAAVVFLGDALTGERNPWLLAASGCSFAIGILGLILDARLPVNGTPASSRYGSG